MKRYDPVCYDDFGARVSGEMRECADGEWVRLEDVQEKLLAAKRPVKQRQKLSAPEAWRRRKQQPWELEHTPTGYRIPPPPNKDGLQS